MPQKQVNFEDVKSILLTRNSSELEKYIRLDDKEIQNKAMFLYWALDYFEQHPNEISKESIDNLKNNRDFLISEQNNIIKEKLDFSLNEYSQGFVLGALEFAIREREAQINLYSEYIELFNKIKRWPDLGFPDEEFQKNWEQRIASIEEILDWMKLRADEWFPIVIMLINSKKYQKSSKVILKTLRKGRNDDITFQILSGILHSNPLLNKRIIEFCKEKDISVIELRNQLKRTLLLLYRETSDRKVKNLCKLFFKIKK